MMKQYGRMNLKLIYWKTNRLLLYSEKEMDLLYGVDI